MTCSSSSAPSFIERATASMLLAELVNRSSSVGAMATTTTSMRMAADSAAPK